MAAALVVDRQVDVVGTPAKARGPVRAAEAAGILAKATGAVRVAGAVTVVALPPTAKAMRAVAAKATAAATDADVDD